MYIGHRREDGEIQQLRDHLLGVAERARGFAEAFGAGGHAYRAGLLHDIGKYAAIMAGGAIWARGRARRQTAPCRAS